MKSNKLKVLSLFAISAMLFACGNGTAQSSSNTSEEPNTSEGSTSEAPATSEDSVTSSDNSTTSSEDATTSENTTSSEDSTTSSNNNEEGVTSLEDVVKDGIALGVGNTSAGSYTFKGTVTGMVGNSYYIQEGNYGTYVYNKQVAGLAVGKKVKVVSPITNYNGLVETTSAAVVTLEGEGDEVTAKDVASFAELTQEMQCTLVNISGLTYVSGSVTVGTSSGVKFKFGSDEIELRTDKYLDDNIESAIKEKMDSITSVDKVNLKGAIVGWYGTKAQIALTSADVIEVVKGQYDAVESVTIAGEKEVQLEVGRKLTLTASVAPATADQSVTWSIAAADAEKAEVSANGVVTAKATGEVTVTAESVGKNASNQTVKDTVKVTIVEGGDKELTLAATYDFTDASIPTSVISDLATLKGYFDTADKGSTGFVTGVTKSAYIYGVTSNQGPQFAHGLKTGTASYNGELTLTTADDVYKVVIVGSCWNATSADKISVNGGEKYGIAYDANNGADEKEVEIELEPANSLAFLFEKRVLISKISFYTMTDVK